MIFFRIFGDDLNSFFMNQNRWQQIDTLFDKVLDVAPNERDDYLFKVHKFETAIGAVFLTILLGWLVTTILQTNSAENQARENRRAAYSAEMVLAANEYETANLNRLKELLEKYQPNENEEDLRGFEWYFLNNLLNPPSKIALFQRNDEVWDAEFSPDGKLIATICNDNFTRIWNVENGGMIETVEQKGAWKASFFPDGNRFSKNGDKLAVSGFETFAIFNTKTWEKK